MGTRFLVLALTSVAAVVACSTGKEDNPVAVEGIEIGGVVWATRNVDEPGTFAATPEDYGKLYQFNSRKAWSLTTRWEDMPQIESESGNWKPENDPCPEGWRLPTAAEFQLLIDKTPEYGSVPSNLYTLEYKEKTWRGWIKLGPGALASGETDETQVVKFLFCGCYGCSSENPQEDRWGEAYIWASDFYGGDLFHGILAASLKIDDVGYTFGLKWEVDDASVSTPGLVRCVKK
ncbi:MAG: fibrobacter succinogenes major paralogous domain-containing protein [Prevotellaceae bacterium]|jgi:uncharacterized protein (TIGR02145 family)|nr:fibrobacter succinogenes major paralogous domain-containing protein [Prevotellaceae bacterium]